MIDGIHARIYAEDAEAARAFFGDVLELPSLDEGDRWLCFALPPAESACHPGFGGLGLYEPRHQSPLPAFSSRWP